MSKQFDLEYLRLRISGRRRSGRGWRQQFGQHWGPCPHWFTCPTNSAEEYDSSGAITGCACLPNFKSPSGSPNSVYDCQRLNERTSVPGWQLGLAEALISRSELDSATPASTEAICIVTRCQSPSIQGRTYRHLSSFCSLSRRIVSSCGVIRTQTKGKSGAGPAEFPSIQASTIFWGLSLLQLKQMRP